MKDDGQGAAGPTANQLALARFADEVEASGMQTSIYYTLWPQIVKARAALNPAVPNPSQRERRHDS